MSDVLAFSGVSVVRGGNTLLADLSRGSRRASAGSSSGPMAPARPRCSSLRSPDPPQRWGRRDPRRGPGAVDVFELRPRIGLASASIAERIPGGERVVDVVVTASYAVVGRWREEYDALDLARAQGLLGSMGVGHLANRSFGTLSEGSANGSR